MPARERRKGVEGEREVRDVFRAAGLNCDRTPNSGGLRLKGDLLGDVPAHVEVKRCETARPWAWYEQARGDAPAGVTPIVAFRRSRSPWLAIIDLESLAALLAATGLARTAEAGTDSVAWIRCTCGATLHTLEPAAVTAFTLEHAGEGHGPA